MTNKSLIVLILLLLLGAGLFFNRATENGRRANDDIDRTDQGAYIKYAIAMRETDFTFVGRRNRMPVFPGLLALFMEKGETPQGFFEKGKQINTWLSLAGLAFVAAAFLKSFPRHHALNLLFLTAFTVFAFKAAYVQAEILYYLLTFAVFLACWSVFRKPRLTVALLAGALLGVAHLTKASVLPGLLVFVVFYPLDALWQLVRGKSREQVRPLARLAVTLLLSIAFLAVVYPYIAKSKEIFGHYFYNVNSTFYMWCESWEDVKERTKAAGDRTGWPDIPDDEIPSLKNYLRTHSAGEIAWRFLSGSSRVFNSMARSYGYLWFCLAYLVLGFWVVWCKRHLIWRLLRQRPFPILALAAYFAGYYLLIAWYSQIIQGNRFILGLFLPFLFTLSALIVPFARRLRLPAWKGRPLPLLATFNILISIWLVMEIVINCFLRLPTTYGGS